MLSYTFIYFFTKLFSYTLQSNMFSPLSRSSGEESNEYISSVCSCLDFPAVEVTALRGIILLYVEILKNKITLNKLGTPFTPSTHERSSDITTLTQSLLFDIMPNAVYSAKQEMPVYFIPDGLVNL